MTFIGVGFGLHGLHENCIGTCIAESGRENVDN